MLREVLTPRNTLAPAGALREALGVDDRTIRRDLGGAAFAAPEQIVAELRQAGLSTRGIGEALGVSNRSLSPAPTARRIQRLVLILSR